MVSIRSGESCMIQDDRGCLVRKMKSRPMGNCQVVTADYDRLGEVDHHSNSPLALWKRYLGMIRTATLFILESKTYSRLFVVRIPSLRVHFHLFFTRCTLSYVQSM